MVLDKINCTLRYYWMLPQLILSTIYPTFLELATPSWSRSIPLKIQWFRDMLMLSLASQEHPHGRPLIIPQNLSNWPYWHPLTHLPYLYSTLPHLRLLIHQLHQSHQPHLSISNPPLRLLWTQQDHAGLGRQKLSWPPKNIVGAMKLPSSSLLVQTSSRSVVMKILDPWTRMQYTYSWSRTVMMMSSTVLVVTGYT